MKSLFIFCLSCIAFGRLLPAEPVVDVYVSTGDNHFLGSSLPIDSPASIEATFDLFKNANHVRRVYWRGLQAACWLATIQARPENPRYFSFWEWLRQLYLDDNPDVLAVKAARARGIEIWGVGSLWDWGSHADTPGFNDYPFCFENKLKLQHPEWAPQDKHGMRRQGGPIELAYPEARKALVAVIVKEAVKAGYDGITFLTYVENYSLRFAGEFGFSDPIVTDFKQQYKLDLRTESFRRGASREDWMRLRGSYVNSFLRELKAELGKHQIKLGVVLNSNDPRQPQSWNVPELTITAGSQLMDVDTWVREGLVDELEIYGNNSSQSQVKTLKDLQFLARGTNTVVSVITSGPFNAHWKPYQDDGMATILAVSDDVQHLARGFIAEQKDLASTDVYQRMRALQQNIEGSLKLQTAPIAALVSSLNLIERRLALQALGKASDAEISLLVAGLSDPENGVRCSAALALAERRDSVAAPALLAAVQKHGNHMLRECVIIALRRLSPVPTEVLRDAMKSPSAGVREVAVRTLLVHPQSALVPLLRTGLEDEHRFVRFVAAEALGGYPRNPEAIDALLQALVHKDPMVVARAATSLGNIFKIKRPEDDASRVKALAALAGAFENAPDDGWSFRPIGNALLDMGDEGAGSLRVLRESKRDHRIAELAWRVLDLTQRTGSFSAVSVEENEAGMRRRPKRDIYVGKDVKSINEGIKLALPGDTIHLEPKIYRDYAGFYDKKGAPGLPITLDGHGATLEGSDPLNPAQWRQIEPGLFASDELLPRLDDAILARWFFLFDGRMNLMGRTSKGKSAPLKKPGELLPGEWTFVKDPSRETPPSKQVYGTFFIKLAPGRRLADEHIFVPVRSAGVQFGKENAHLVIKNLTATHPYNDGFNIHGDCRDVVFENISAIECGDDGISAHESAQYRVDGFVSIGNSTGITDTGTAQTSYNRVFIAKCVGFDVFFLDEGRYTLTNAVILSSAQNPLAISGRENGECRVKMENVLFRRIVTPNVGSVSTRAVLEAKRCTFENMELKVTGTARWENCVINGKAQSDGAKIPGANEQELLKLIPPGFQ